MANRNVVSLLIVCLVIMALVQLSILEAKELPAKLRPKMNYRCATGCPKICNSLKQLDCTPRCERLCIDIQTLEKEGKLMHIEYNKKKIMGVPYEELLAKNPTPKELIKLLGPKHH